MLRSSTVFNDGNVLLFYLLGQHAGGGSVPDTPAGSWIAKVTDTASGYLNENEMRHNAKLVWAYFRTQLGWNINSVCALLGNMEGESTINPGLIEVGGGTTSAGAGRGLVQWTPASDLYNALDILYGKHDDWSDGNKQMALIYAEYQETMGITHTGIEKQWYSTSEYPLTWAQWASNELNYSLQDLVYSFAANYLRPAVVKQPRRVSYAQKWLAYFVKG